LVGPGRRACLPACFPSLGCKCKLGRRGEGTGGGGETRRRRYHICYSKIALDSSKPVGPDGPTVTPTSATG
jgi:hypothetical protein